MKTIVVATIALFTGVLAVCWVIAERAHPVFIQVDPAKPSHH